MASKELNAGDGFLISDGNTDLRRGHTLLCHGDNEFTNAFRSMRHPLGASSLEGGNGGADTLPFSFTLHSSHW